MKVRAIDSQNDWTFGKGKNDYKSGIDACAQNIKTRLQLFLGDCFFALENGIDWFNLNGSKNIEMISISVRTTILNTPDVIGINSLSISLDNSRVLSFQYEASTVYGEVSATDNIFLN
jgi:hypothetical protein